MLLRPITLSILIFIFLAIAIFEIYLSLASKHTVYRINPNYRWIGIIDMDHDHGLDIRGVINGEDALVVLDFSNPLFLQLIGSMKPQNPESLVQNFDITNFDSNGDGILNEEDPIFKFLDIVSFIPGQPDQGYQVRSLTKAGIRGINLKRPQAGPDHVVIMSDGSTRAYYEINKPDGSSIYRNQKGTVIAPMPAPPRPTNTTLKLTAPWSIVMSK